MNSIEVASNPDKSRDNTKSPGRLGVAGEFDKPVDVLHVYVKDKASYKLDLETRDFQHAMKHAAKLEAKGQDILVNDRNTPIVVYAKTNRHNDIDVGREIRPELKDGKYVQGPGEALLLSFYAKLPLDTKEFDEAHRGKSRESAPGAKTVTLDKDDASAPAKGASAPSDKDSLKVGEPPERQKVILKKDGFELPEAVRGAYKILDGKYHDKDSNALRFEDHGKRLSTPVEDRAVIADMISVAAAKNWAQLELKGTDTFKQLAWLEAESRGIQTKGYKPNERDLEQLDRMKPERGVQEPAANDKNEHVAVEGAKELVKATSIRLAASYADDPNARNAENAQAGRLEDAAYKKLATVSVDRAQSLVATERANVTKDGQLQSSIHLDVAKHQAAMQDKDKGKMAAEPGKEAKAPNQMLVVTRVLSADEKVKADVASRVLDKELQKYPENVRKEILARVSEKLEKGELKLPTPTVSERTVDKKQAPAPTMDRSR